MSNQYSQPNPKSSSMRDSANQASEAVKDTFAKATDMARDATQKAQRAASDTASTVTEQVKELLDRQISNSAGVVEQFAHTAKRVADDLDQESPFVANFVRSLAGKIEDYADDLQDQTVEQLARAASDFTRRQPALVFGIAALAGFFVFRTMKSTQAGSSTPSPSIQPSNQFADQDYG